MPNIVFASSKGGAGKSTGVITLCGELARMGEGKGVTIALIDSDPNRHSAKWAQMDASPESITVYDVAVEDDLLSVIKDAESKFNYVIIDVAGKASVAIGEAVQRADIVLIPVQASQHDAIEAVRTIELVKQQESISGRSIPYSVYFTRTQPAYMSKMERHVREEFEKNNVAVLPASLYEKEAFKAVCSFGGSVSDLDRNEVSGVVAAIKYADDFAREILKALKRAITEVEA